MLVLRIQTARSGTTSCSCTPAASGTASRAAHWCGCQRAAAMPAAATQAALLLVPATPGAGRQQAPAATGPAAPSSAAGSLPSGAVDIQRVAWKSQQTPTKPHTCPCKLCESCDHSIAGQAAAACWSEHLAQLHSRATSDIPSNTDSRLKAARRALADRRERAMAGAPAGPLLPLHPPGGVPL